MAITPTDLLKEGMVLEAPVKNPQGQVLFGIGHELKAKHIDMMLAWGITEAEVKAEEDSEAARIIQEKIEKEEGKLQSIFTRCDTSETIVKETIRSVAELRVDKQMRAQL